MRISSTQARFAEPSSGCPAFDSATTLIPQSLAISSCFHHLTMAGVDTNLAATALAISLVAFFIALGQLLQQYFATADGYRRCQRSVMGGWAKKTRLRWRWREFRFETLYTTPEILLGGSNLSWGHEDTLVMMDGSDTSKALCLIDYSMFMKNSHERAGWLELLENVQSSISLLGVSQEVLKQYNMPILQFQENSWDFQLPDVVRPLAKTSVATIAIIARRLGMRWKEFDPIHGTMRAEGNGQIITATTIRSLGTVIQYNRWRPVLKKVPQERYIPVDDADLLGFGRIEGRGGPFLVGTRQQVLATLRTLEPSGDCATILQKLYEQDPNYHLRIGSLVAIVADWIRPEGSTLTQVPAPGENMLGFTQTFHGRHVFRRCLEDFCKSREVGVRAKFVLDSMKKYIECFNEWSGETESPGGSQAPAADVHRRKERPNPMQDYGEFSLTYAEAAWNWKAPDCKIRILFSRPGSLSDHSNSGT